MHTGKKSSNHHKTNEQGNENPDALSEGSILNAGIKLHHSSGHDAHHKHRGGGWIGSFQIPIDQHRPIVHNMRFKEKICCQYDHVESAKHQKTEIYMEKILSLNPLDKTQARKPKSKCNRYQSQPIGDGVYDHMHSGPIVEHCVDGCKSNGGTTGADCLYINEDKGNGPQRKCCKQTQGNNKILFYFLSHYVLSFLLCTRFLPKYML